MTTFRAARGTRDLLPDETPTWSRLERLADDLAARYGYRRIETPMFEQAAVFERGLTGAAFKQHVVGQHHRRAAMLLQQRLDVLNKVELLVRRRGPDSATAPADRWRR